MHRFADAGHYVGGCGGSGAAGAGVGEERRGSEAFRFSIAIVRDLFRFATNRKGKGQRTPLRSMLQTTRAQISTSGSRKVRKYKTGTLHTTRQPQTTKNGLAGIVSGVLEESASMLLVPKLRLGTHFAKLRFAALTPRRRECPTNAIAGRGNAPTKRSFAECVPKRSLGTRKKRGAFKSRILFFNSSNPHSGLEMSQKAGSSRQVQWLRNCVSERPSG